jgi:hypothetical protein
MPARGIRALKCKIDRAELQSCEPLENRLGFDDLNILEGTVAIEIDEEALVLDNPGTGCLQATDKPGPTLIKNHRSVSPARSRQALGAARRRVEQLNLVDPSGAHGHILPSARPAGTPGHFERPRFAPVRL